MLLLKDLYQELRILDRGFDYEETPTITISGGNGSGAVS